MSRASIAYLMCSFVFVAAANAQNFASPILTPPFAGSHVQTLSYDMNADGLADILELTSAPGSSGTVSVYLSNGGGTFRGPEVFPVTETPSQMVVADFNGDGNLDVAVVGSTASGSSIEVLYGSGSGTLAAPITYPLTVPASFLATGDFNNDGRADLAVTSSNTKQVEILTNTGSGFTSSTFSVPTSFDTSNPGYMPDYLSYIVAGDFNADGRMDLAYVDNCGDPGCIVLQEHFWVLLNTTSGFKPVDAKAGGTGTNSFKSIDVDLDGRSDLVATYYGCYHTACYGSDVIYSNADGTFTTVQVQNGDVAGDPPLSDSVVADFNGDGIMDIAVPVNSNTYSPTSGIDIYYGKGNRTFNGTPQHFASIATQVQTGIVAGFFDTKGTKDIAIPDANNAFEVFLNNGATNPLCAYDDLPGVKVCMPASGATVFSPVRVLASYHAQREQANRIEVWIDGNKVFQNFNDFLDHSFTEAAGTHSLSVVGVDASGKYVEHTSTITVEPGNGCSAPFSPGIQLCTPTTNASVANPVRFTATSTAASGQYITAVRLYVDNVSLVTQNSPFLDTTQTLSVGSHYVAVVAYTNTGASYRAVETITVLASNGCSAPSSAGIHLCTPAPNASVANPVRFTATSTAVSGQHITAVRLYVDNISRVTQNSSFLDTTQTLGLGSHYVAVVAYTNTGGAYKAAETITVH